MPVGILQSWNAMDVLLPLFGVGPMMVALVIEGHFIPGKTQVRHGKELPSRVEQFEIYVGLGEARADNSESDLRLGG